MCMHILLISLVQIPVKLGMHTSPGFPKLVPLLRQFLLKLSVFLKESLCCLVPSDSQDPFRYYVQRGAFVITASHQKANYRPQREGCEN